MGKMLILTEKPSVGMDFAKALGTRRGEGHSANEKYIITWGIGHLLESLAPDEYNEKFKKWDLQHLPIIPNEFRLKPVKGTEQQLKNIKDLFDNESIDTVVIATDAGREGELIGREILAHIGANGKVLKRFWTSQALTKAVIEEQMKALRPAAQYAGLYAAGLARQQADWLIGMNLTRAATKKFSTSGVLSIGRVQTAVLALLVDRKSARDTFKSEPYFLLKATFRNESGDWQGGWYSTVGNRISNKADAEKIQSAVSGQTGVIEKVDVQEKAHPAPKLFSLTDLQRMANTKFGYTAKVTLELAQRLYEERKCLSYPRTDANYLGASSTDLVRDILSGLAGHTDLIQHVNPSNIDPKNKKVFDDAKLTDHHALIPLAPLPAGVSAEEKNIYDQVLRRFIAVLADDQVCKHTAIITAAAGHTFRTQGKQVLKPGWTAVYADQRADEDDGEEGEAKLPESLILTQGTTAQVLETDLTESKTTPSPEYTEASLLGDMANPAKYVAEEAHKKLFRGDIGLGTQATRAQIIETLIARQYAVRVKKKIQPTDTGVSLIQQLRTMPRTADLTKPEVTAAWELDLAEVEQGTKSSEDFMVAIKHFLGDAIAEFQAAESKFIGAGGGSQGDGGKSGLFQCRCKQGSIEQNKHGYWCRACKLSLPLELCGKKLTEKQIRAMVEKGRSPLIKGFKSKKGSDFDAVLVLSKDGKIVFEFPKDKKK